MGLGGGNAGAKFVVQFSIEGSGEKDLERIAGVMKGLQGMNVGGAGHGGHGIGAGLGKAHENAESLTGSLEGAGHAMGGVALAAHAVSEIMDHVAEGGVKMMEMGVAVVEGWAKGFESLLEKGSEFEQMIIRIRASGKTSAEAQGMVEGAVDIASQLPITERDATRIVQTMATAHVDALARIGESYEELDKKGKTLKGLKDILGVDEMIKKGPTAVTVVSDVLAAAGQLGGKDSGMAIHELMLLIETGKLGSRMRFGALTEELRHVGKAGKNAADRIKHLQEMLEKRGALGAAQASMNTLAGQMTNLKGILDMISLSVMEAGKAGGLQDRFVQGFKYLIDTAREFFNPHSMQGQKFLGMLKETAGFVADVFIAIMRKAGDVLRVVLGFMADHPGLMKFAAGMSLVVAGMLIFGGAATVVAATLLGAIAVIALFPEVLLVIPVAIGLVIASFAALTGALLVGYAAYKAFEADFGGIKTFFADVGLIIDATREALDNWNGSLADISEETAQKLEKAGMMGFFLRTIYWIRQAQVYWEGFSDAIEHRWDTIGAKFGHAWAQASNAMGRVMTALGHVMAVLMGTGDSVDQTTRKGEDFGNAVADVLDKLADLAAAAAEWLDESVSAVPELTDQLADVYETALIIKNVFDILWDVGSGSALALAGGFRLVSNAVLLALDLVIGLNRAIERLLHLDFSGVATAIKNMGKDMAKHTVNSVKSAAHLSDMSLDQFGKIAGDMDDIENAKAKAEAMRKKGRDWRFERTGTPLSPTHTSAVPTPPAVIGPPRWEDTQEYQVAKEKQDRLAGARAPADTGTPVALNLKGDVNLDGQKIGEVSWNHVKEEMEKAGYHPGARM